MNQAIGTAQAVVGGSLVGGGALLTGLGTTQTVERALSLSITGASLITAGIIYLLAAAALSSQPRITIGAILTATGTTVAVLGTTLGSNTTTIAVALSGGSLLTAGVIQLLQGATSHKPTQTAAP